MPPKQDPLPSHIEHVVVLMLENRSFDHMLGYLEHPDPTFDGLQKDSYPPGEQPSETTMDARYTIYPGPDHSHRGSMHQLLGTEELTSGANSYAVNNRGYIASYEKRLSTEFVNAGYGKKVMRSFNPRMVPVLSKLALEYAVCDRWFCSGPMQTLPNRDFMHAGTSFGRVGNSIAFRDHRTTIFDRLKRSGKSWNLYHRNLCHLWTYPQLFEGHNRSRSHGSFFRAITNNDLPTYSFIEPDYGNVTPLGGKGESQHPSQADSLEEFIRGEDLIARVYEALAAKPDLFEKTVLVITYDEHGGFYDHAKPPTAYSVHHDDYYRTEIGGEEYVFKFNLLGPRVPAIIVSPWIKKATVDHTEFDHTSIYQTLRMTYCENYMPNSDRDGTANTFAHLLTLDTPRTKRGEIDGPATSYPQKLHRLTAEQARGLQQELAAPPDDSDVNPEFEAAFEMLDGLTAPDES